MKLLLDAYTLQAQTEKTMHFPNPRKSGQTGFTFAETMVASLIIGTLSAIAIPNFMGALNSTKERGAQSTVEKVQTLIMAHIDETGETPKTWKNINSIGAIMKVGDDGYLVESDANDFSEITLPGNSHTLEVTAPSTGENIYRITTNLKGSDPDNATHYCLNVSNGASYLSRGTSSSTNCE